MKYTNMIIVDEARSREIDKLLTTKPETKSDCFGENEKISYTVELPGNMLMDIEICGVQYEEDQDNLPWTQAVLYQKGKGDAYQECTFTDVSEDLFGLWELEFEGNVYAVDVKRASDLFHPVIRQEEDRIFRISKENLELLLWSSIGGKLQNSEAGEGELNLFHYTLNELVGYRMKTSIKDDGRISLTAVFGFAPDVCIMDDTEYVEDMCEADILKTVSTYLGTYISGFYTRSDMSDFFFISPPKVQFYEIKLLNALNAEDKKGVVMTCIKSTHMPDEMEIRKFVRSDPKTKALLDEHFVLDKIERIDENKAKEVYGVTLNDSRRILC